MAQKLWENQKIFWNFLFSKIAGTNSEVYWWYTGTELLNSMIMNPVMLDRICIFHLIYTEWI